jgi:hypothetical protein
VVVLEFPHQRLVVRRDGGAAALQQQQEGGREADEGPHGEGKRDRGTRHIAAWCELGGLFYIRSAQMSAVTRLGEAIQSRDKLSCWCSE